MKQEMGLDNLPWYRRIEWFYPVAILSGFGFIIFTIWCMTKAVQ